MYTPPFTITSTIVNLIAEISAQIERYAIRLEQSDGLRLRRANRIKTIHSSLAIEGNTLNETEVRDIIEGKNIVAPIKQIKEVKNAIKTYELYPSLNPFDVKDLLKAHEVMMQALIDDAGVFRRRGVGVAGERGLIHVAPPADRVPYLIGELFEWLRSSSDHLLIRSCVFHYEFEFIHPFSDGNGRTGRLWQSLILGRLHPLFEHLPVENMVYSNQQAYYDAIETANRQGDSTPFVEFMLGEILRTLKSHQGAPVETDGSHNNQHDKSHDKSHDKLHDKFPHIQEKAWRVYEVIAGNSAATADSISAATGISVRMVRQHIATLKENGIIRRKGSNKTGSWEIVEDFGADV